MDLGDVGAVSVALEELGRVLRQLSPSTGFSLTGLATLAELHANGPARLTELAVRQGVSQPGMTQLITRLQDAGLVERVSVPGDARVVEVHITPAGRAELVQRRTVRSERLAGVLAQLSVADQRAIVAAMPAISRLARQVAASGVGV